MGICTPYLGTPPLCLHGPLPSPGVHPPNSESCSGIQLRAQPADSKVASSWESQGAPWAAFPPCCNQQRLILILRTPGPRQRLWLMSTCREHCWVHAQTLSPEGLTSLY